MPTCKLELIQKNTLDSYPQNFNSCFHSEKEAPEDQPPRLDLTFHGVWFALICASQKVKLSDAHVIQIPKQLARHLQQASLSGIITGRLGASALEDICEYSWDLNSVDLSGGYFMRLDLCSAKDGHDNQGPVFSALDVWKHIVTSHRAICSIKTCLEQNLPVQVFLTPWDQKMNTRHEWRVFVSPARGSNSVKIGAISQYSWHQILDPAATITDTGLIYNAAQLLLDEIIAFPHPYQQLLQEQGFVFDMLLPPPFNGDPILVELNTFGSRSGCGSALFHWLHDRQQLYGQKEEAVIRVLID